MFEEMTVRENLLVASDDQTWRPYLTDLFRPRAPAATALVTEVVEELQLGDVLDVRPSSLPHGVTRLVGIARALVTEPAVLLLDEPAAGLDTNESTELGRVIRALARRRGIGVLVVEHDVPLILQTCDRIVALDFGHTIAEGTPDSDQSRRALSSRRTSAPTRSRACNPDRRHERVPSRPTASSPGTARSRSCATSTSTSTRARCVALLGPNRAGKTTTISTLTGELPALGGETRLFGARTDAPLHVPRGRGSAWYRSERRC